MAQNPKQLVKTNERFKAGFTFRSGRGAALLLVLCLGFLGRASHNGSRLTGALQIATENEAFLRRYEGRHRLLFPAAVWGRSLS